MSQDLYSLILQKLAVSNSGSAIGSMARELLAIDSNSDPEARANIISNYIIKLQEEDFTNEEAQPEVSASQKLDGQHSYSTLSSRKKQIAIKVRQKIEAIRRELEELRGKNDILAAALGACYLCWGEDNKCAVCQGKGQPGFLTPEQELFDRIVLPAVRKIQESKKSNAQNSTLS